ncbi:MAG: hypothetical protein GEV11_14985 [Streptosporangiales bacterium]|nr:hypothetical protein [Streptosporangiales bacterium]
MAFINYTLGAQQQTKMSELTSYSPVHSDAKPKLDALGEEFNTSRPEVIRQQVPVDNAYWGAHQQELTEAWTKWLN